MLGFVYHLTSTKHTDTPTANNALTTTALPLPPPPPFYFPYLLVRTVRARRNHDHSRLLDTRFEYSFENLLKSTAISIGRFALVWLTLFFLCRYYSKTSRGCGLSEGNDESWKQIILMATKSRHQEAENKSIEKIKNTTGTSGHKFIYCRNLKFEVDLWICCFHTQYYLQLLFILKVLFIIHDNAI